MLYESARGLARLAVRLYYGDVQFEGLDNVPTDGPLLMVSNHPNGLIDPMLTAAAVDRKFSLTARNTLLGTPIIGTILRALNVVPLHRRQDDGAGADRTQNGAALSGLAERLLEGGAALIFPEGETNPGPDLKLIRWGAAKLAIDVMGRIRPGQAPLRIVPVGVHYESVADAGSDVLVRFGEPLDTQVWAERRRQLGLEVNYEVLNREIERRLRRVAPIYRDEEERRELQNAGRVIAMASDANGAPTRDWPATLAATRRLRRALNEIETPTAHAHERGRATRMRRRISEWNEALAQAGAAGRDADLPLRPATGPVNRPAALLGLALSKPLAWLGAALHKPLGWINRAVLKKREIKTAGAIVSNLFFTSLPALPVLYGAYAGIATALAGGWAGLAVAVLTPALGALALRRNAESLDARRRIAFKVTLRRNPALRGRLAVETRDLRREMRGFLEKDTTRIHAIKQIA